MAFGDTPKKLVDFKLWLAKLGESRTAEGRNTEKSQ